MSTARGVPPPGLFLNTASASLVLRAPSSELLAVSFPHAPRFTKDTLKFLRALKRNNDREWFRSRKDDYEQHVRAPMIAVIEQLAKDLPRLAPELIASPKASLYRIYRDTRFSEDKTPLKTNAAAAIPWKGLEKHEGAGLYFEVAPGWVWIGGGMYAPPSRRNSSEVREHIVDTWPEIRKIAKSKAFGAASRRCTAIG